MTLVHNVKSELEPYLKILLKNENVNNLEYNIIGNSEKGDGYMGDIVFVNVSGTSKDGNSKNYDLVLKCSKTSQALREKSPVKPAFLNEIYFYNVVYPIFTQFQKDRNIDDPFDKIPKCFGTISTGDMEIIALENLKSKGYILWERTKPLTRKHIDLVVKEYGKLHSISIAMKQQEPAKLQDLVEGLDHVLRRFIETTEVVQSIELAIQDVFDLLSGDLDASSLNEWLKLKPLVRSIFDTTGKPVEGLNVITHGDCWNNNFMHYHTDKEPTTFAMLDWQLSTFTSPVTDLSYFLFTCLSEEDMNDLDTILKQYHTSLTIHLSKLGSDVASFYPLEQFLDDWKKYSNFGVILSTVIHKFSLSENEDVPDMAKAAENGEDVGKIFAQPIKNIAGYKSRMKYIVKHVSERKFI